MFYVDYDDNEGDMIPFESEAEARSFADKVDGMLYDVEDGELICID